MIDKNNFDVERELIGCIIAHPFTFSQISDFLFYSDFDDNNHREVFRAISKLCDTDNLDFGTLAAWLQSAGTLDQIGGQYFLSMYANTQGNKNTLYYARLVKEKRFKNDLTLKITSLADRIKSTDGIDLIDELKNFITTKTVSLKTNSDGIVEPLSLTEDILNYYNNQETRTYSTGVPGLDDNYMVKPGELTLVHGIPSSGKSEFLDQILLNLANYPGWKFAVYSPENYPLYYHLRKLIEKQTGKSFLRSSSKHISEQEILHSTTFLNNHFSFVYPPETEITLDHILGKFRFLIETKKINGVVLDPWNTIDHQRPRELNETEYISKCLTKIVRFSRENNICFWLVVHPRILDKNKDGKYDPPSAYELSGSAHWRNKSDNILCVHRDFTPSVMGDISPEVQIHVQKVRFKSVGKMGLVKLKYDYETGRYE
jgi:replicative DNA helicase